jgi:hypothetical protein
VATPIGHASPNRLGDFAPGHLTRVLCHLRGQAPRGGGARGAGERPNPGSLNRVFCHLCRRPSGARKALVNDLVARTAGYVGADLVRIASQALAGAHHRLGRGGPSFSSGSDQLAGTTSGVGV